MVHNPLFHELVLVALLWLLMISYRVWKRGQAALDPAQPTPAQRTTRRSKDPQPFAGLTTRPLCVACAQGQEPTLSVRSAPPPMIISTRGRPHQVDTCQHYCPTPCCRYYGWVGLGNIRANGHPGGGPWRQLQCVACRTFFQETHGTLFFGRRVPAEQLVRVVASLAEGLGLRAVARVFEVDPNTVLQWLVEAAAQLQAFARHCLHDVQVSQVQLDELFAVLSEVKTGQVSEAEAVERLAHSSHWVWVAIDPVSKLLLAVDVGERSLEVAQRLVHHVRQVLAPGCLPLFVTDGLKEYATALLTHWGHWVPHPRQRASGPAAKPRWLPQPELLYARVIKTYRRRRLVRMRPQVVFGTLAQVMQVLAPLGWHINTAFIERLNLTLRHHVAAVGRRVITLCKGAASLRSQLHLSHTYYNFCLPHISLRVPLALPQPTKGRGSVKRWRPCTPAMAAGLTDRVWTLREVLLFRVPPWPQPQGR